MSHNNLVVAAFKKAMESLVGQGVVEPSKKAAAEILADYIYGEFNFQFGERRLRDYYNAALAREEVAIAQQAVRDGLAHYVGFENYAEWAVAQGRLDSEPQTNPYPLAQYLGKNKTTLFIGIASLVLFLIVNSLNSEKWMEWNGDQYVATKFDEQRLSVGEIWPIDKNRMSNFKRIAPDCNTSFFDFNGNAKVWYGKNDQGELEYFTDLGRHPETGKTLRPITRYMINKYVCPVSVQASD